MSSPPGRGVTPELAAGQAARLAGLADYLVVVRGSIYSVPATRPDLHTEPGAGIELCRQIRAVAGGTPVVLQGSVADPGQAQRALDDGAADLAEMTRAQITDPSLVRLLRSGQPGRIRPCLLCNQACMVRDNRNPIISCVIEPGSGHELDSGHQPGSAAAAGNAAGRARRAARAGGRRRSRRDGGRLRAGRPRASGPARRARPGPGRHAGHRGRRAWPAAARPGGALVAPGAGPAGRDRHRSGTRSRSPS